MINNFDETIKKELTERLKKIEEHLDSDVVFFFGPIEPGLEKLFRDFIETLKAERDKEKLSIIVNTPGGSAETVEKMVTITRQHYDTVDFIVPDSAMSAGTIFCMSGDNIYMDYSASLGPIDPQVYNGHRWVPALGYLDKFEELVQKSQQQPLSQAELFLLQQQDMAMLTSYEQARDLTVSLLKQWLVEYKFKNWDTHASNGTAVTPQEKEERAGEIAKILGDNRRWHSHGRAISMKTLQEVLKLKIIDFGQDQNLKVLLRDYNDMLCEYIRRHNNRSFLHSRVFFLKRKRWLNESKDRVEALLSTADTYEDFNDSCKQFEDIKATFEAFNAIKSAQIKENHADADTMQVENSHSFGSSWSGYKPMHTSYQWNRT